jgi:hypothetical protein
VRLLFQVYEIIIGGWGNTASEIRIGMQGTTLSRNQTANFLKVDEFRAFYISWDQTNLIVGRVCQACTPPAPLAIAE